MLSHSRGQQSSWRVCRLPQASCCQEATAIANHTLRSTQLLVQSNKSERCVPLAGCLCWWNECCWGWGWAYGGGVSLLSYRGCLTPSTPSWDCQPCNCPRSRYHFHLGYLRARTVAKKQCLLCNCQALAEGLDWGSHERIYKAPCSFDDTHTKIYMLPFAGASGMSSCSAFVCKGLLKISFVEVSTLICDKLSDAVFIVLLL